MPTVKVVPSFNEVEDRHLRFLMRAKPVPVEQLAPADRSFKGIRITVRDRDAQPAPYPRVRSEARLPHPRHWGELVTLVESGL